MENETAITTVGMHKYVTLYKTNRNHG